ncbi:GntR family transcriptional regulator [Bacillus alkalicellulosilyticus]|uniref:GntR family transcriptional regulator n=1 Tax=Alkalihalobacterium alkalicellulosilyticum TaxID=1912214 RepID=UPI00099676BD|nr:GntR family transcriptional regulator [Bacillus alkalicellulosilyticus]
MFEKEASLQHIVKEAIVEKIKQGIYQIGDKLPPEIELCKMFNVSRTTVRLALQQLTLEGRIYRIQGSGSYVSEPKITQSLSSSGLGFANQMLEQGYQPKVVVIDLRVIPADSSLAEKLQLNETDPLTKLTRIRYANEIPIQYETSYIPWKFAPGLVEEKEDSLHSLFSLLQTKYNIKIHKTVESLEPIIPTTQLCTRLQMIEGTPAFQLETTTYNQNQAPIEYSEAIFRGDRSKFTIERYY